VKSSGIQGEKQWHTDHRSQRQLQLLLLLEQDPAVLLLLGLQHRLPPLGLLLPLRAVPPAPCSHPWENPTPSPQGLCKRFEIALGLNLARSRCAVFAGGRTTLARAQCGPSVGTSFQQEIDYYLCY